MKTYEFKNELFVYFNLKLSEKFPELSGKIFRERLRINQPAFPFVVLKSGERSRINKRYEHFLEGNQEHTRVQYRMPVTFAVHDVKNNPIEAEMFSDTVIDYIEMFFADNDTTHNDLREKGIIVNELMVSPVRDTSSFSKTAQEFVREIDIVFEFEDIMTILPDEGKKLSVDINPV